MGASAVVHPSDETLIAYGLRTLNDELFHSVNKHLKSCPPCQRRVTELASHQVPGAIERIHVSRDKAAPEWSLAGALLAEADGGFATSPPPADTLPPELVDHPDYEIVRELGRGGMGVVYLVRNKLMGRFEVLKVVSGQLIARAGVRDRFLREVQAAAKLQHVNIVAAYSAMRLGESIALAMEFIDGEDLAKMVKSRGPLPVLHACYFGYQAAVGLQHAHERGMVHRDIKPANLIVARDGKKGVVKVLDFGLAKVTGEGQSDTGLTREGQMLGTPDFIAPEQIRDAQSADIRADIYSLGCTLYYLLTGEPPFRGEHLWDVYQAHFSKEPAALNLIRPAVPIELAAVVGRMMAKDPRRRFQTPGEVALALAPFFKPAAKTAPANSHEVPSAGHAASATVRNQAGTQRASDAGAPPSAEPPPSRAPAPEGVAWDTLIDLGEPEQIAASLKPRPLVAPLPRPRTRWVWPALAGGLVFIALLTWRFYPRANEALVAQTPSNRKPSGNLHADKPSVPPAKSRPSFPADAKLFAGKRYKAFNEHLTWHQARNKCRDLGGHLAIIRSDSENQFITSLISDAGMESAWLGVTDEEREGHWVCVDGSALLYSNWDDGQPTNEGGRGPENYVVIMSHHGRWNDYYADGTNPHIPGFVCQWERGITRSSVADSPGLSRVGRSGAASSSNP
jgi:serine/threonine protein kinase